MFFRLLILFCALSASLFAQGDILEDYVNLASPDGRIEFRLFNAPPDTDESQLIRLAYSVLYRGKLLIDTSSLGFDLEDQVPLGEKLAVNKLTRETVDDTFDLPVGKASRIRNHYNSLVVDLLQEGSQGRWLVMEIRAFNDGVAFRYYVPWSAPLDDMRILNERTQFQLARDATVYAQTPRRMHGNYEDDYRPYTLSSIHPDDVIALPLLAEQPGVGWVGITEANVNDYPGLYLRHIGDRILRANLAPMLDGSDLAARRSTPFETPWRVLLIGDNAAEFAASNIVASLNESSVIGDTSWIQPGPPDQWVTADWIDIEANYQTLFPQYQARSVRGVTIDNILREDQAFSNTLRVIAANAAEHHLMLALHGTSKPDGSARTYPHVLVREAALTSEYAQWGARANPEHNVRLAFTRLMAGPIDYAPGGRAMPREEFVPGEGVLGTDAHQLGLLLVFASPLQRWSGTPSDFVKAVPATWDETRSISGGDPSTYFAIARRKGDDWWLGAINNWTARTIELDLSFLNTGEYVAEIHSDAGVSERRVQATDSLKIDLASGGGAAIRFRLARGSDR